MRRGSAIDERGHMSKNLSTVQSIYAAFGRGDVPAILEHISDECDWEYGGSTADVPWLQRGTGRAAVGAFFQAVGSELEMKSFAVNAVVESERIVLALIDIELVVRRTGKTVRDTDEAHVWH